MKVGDLVKHEYERNGYGVGVVLEMFQRDGRVPGAPWSAKALWSGWRGVASVEVQYLEVIDETA